MNLKIAFIVAGLLICRASFSQEDAGSFRQYSYLLYGKGTNGIVTGSAAGTCFFVRKGGRLFLITAKHVLCGCGGGKKSEYYPDKLMVRRMGGMDTLAIDISRIRDTATLMEPYLEPDVMAMEVPNDTAISSAERFLMPPFRKVGRLIACGYSGSAVMREGQLTSPAEASLMSFPKDSYLIGTAQDSASPAIDSLNYCIMPKGGASGIDFRGWSGSPVFIEDARSKKWRICGVFVASSTQRQGIVFAAKIEYALQGISNLLASDPELPR
ncbi:hypothetical protein [Parasediminibacterium sp. JCM 36343]|uniref:hypothetical protein n=1 Tax=Parasediminibacterium sp. JCM 36343 TaxID=3374279 RepID=UPI00397A5420